MNTPNKQHLKDLLEYNTICFTQMNKKKSKDIQKSYEFVLKDEIYDEIKYLSLPNVHL